MARGIKTGGRQKGSRNKITLAKTAAIAASGITPLAYMLRVLRNPKAPVERRDEMAKAAAPYVHPKLAAIEHTGPSGGPIQTESKSDNELARRIAFALAKGLRSKDQP